VSFKWLSAKSANKAIFQLLKVKDYIILENYNIFRARAVAETPSILVVAYAVSVPQVAINVFTIECVFI